MLIDRTQSWVRHPSDLVGAIGALFSLIIVLLLAIYATTTTLAVESDVRQAATSFVIFQQLLAIPINFLESIASFVVPLIILSLLIWRLRWRTLITSLIAAISAFTAIVGTSKIIQAWWSEWFFSDILKVTTELKTITSASPFLAMVTAILVVAGATKGSLIMKSAWWLLSTVMFFSILQGRQSLNGVLFTLLTGIFIGLLSRWIIGSEPHHAANEQLIKLIQRIGIDARKIVRIDQTENPPQKNDSSFTASWLFCAKSPSDKNETNVKNKNQTENALALLPEINIAQNLQEAQESCKIASRQFDSRIYYAEDSAGRKYQLIVLDEDRRILGVLETLWQKIRLKKSFRKATNSLQAIAEQMILMILQAERLKLTSKIYQGVAGSDDSVLIALTATSAPLLSELTPTEINSISETQLDELWAQLKLAHNAGITHAQITASHVAFEDGKLKLSSWDGGSIISSEYARQIDFAQMLTMLTAVFGIKKALASMNRALPLAQIISLAPFLQRAILPEETRQFFVNKQEFRALREAIVEKFPETSSATPVTLQRFSLKTIFTAIIGVTAATLLIGSMNFADVSAAISYANPFLMAISFVAALFTYLGAAITLKAYVPEPVKLSEAILVQIAASLATLIMPAGVGPAALNLRFLQKRGIATTPALATATIVQIAQFGTTFLLLLILSFSVGEIQGVNFPNTAILTIVGILLLAVALIVLIPRIRDFIWSKIKPLLEQILPRLIWLVTHPERIFYGLIGTLITTTSFVACFALALLSFGETLPLITLTITYLLANSIGSALPSPGGIGPVEAALTGGLVIAGVPYSIAFSTAVLYRLLTFWGRAPLGWVALRIADKKNLI